MGDRERRHRQGRGASPTDHPTKFKTASQAGNPPDVVVWAHDVIGDFVQNGAIDPIQGLTDTSAFDPLAIKGMTFGGKLYGVPYSVENIALIRNTDLAPDCAGDDGRPGHGGQAAGRPTRRPRRSWPSRSARRATPYHIYPVFTSGGGSFFGADRDRRPGPEARDRRLARVDRRRPEDLRHGREGRRRPQALDRRQERDPAVHGQASRRSWSPARGRSPTSRRPASSTTSAPIPPFAGGTAGRSVHRRQWLLRREQGREQDSRPGVRRPRSCRRSTSRSACTRPSHAGRR